MKLSEEFKKRAGDIKIIAKDEEKEIYSHDIGDVPAIMSDTFFEIQPDFVVQPKTQHRSNKSWSLPMREKFRSYREAPRRGDLAASFRPGPGLLLTCLLFEKFCT